MTRRRRLLEVLDPEQNNTFADHYLEIPYDLSKVMFITTANSLATIPRPLLDRMEVIQIPGYTLDEKLEIAKRYRVPRQLKAHGLDGKLTLTDNAVRRTITEYTREAGVRNLDRTLAKLARKSAKEYLSAPWQGVRTLDENSVRQLLGVPPFRDERAEREPQIGVAHGLAYTPVGGVTLDIEALSTPGQRQSHADRATRRRDERVRASRDRLPARPRRRLQHPHRLSRKTRPARSRFRRRDA